MKFMRERANIIFESVSSIRYKLAYTYSEDSNQYVHPHCLISLSFLPEEMLNH